MKYLNQIQLNQLQRTLRWKLNFCGLQGPKALEFGWIRDLNYPLIRELKVSIDFQRELEKRIEHPYMRSSVWNSWTGEQAKTMHSMTTKNRRPLMIECCPRLDKKMGRQFIHNEGLIEYGSKSLYQTEQVSAEKIPDLVQNVTDKLFDLEKANKKISNEILETDFTNEMDLTDLPTPSLHEMSSDEYQDYLQEQKVVMELKNSENILVPTDSYFLNFQGLYQYLANNGWFY